MVRSSSANAATHILVPCARRQEAATSWVIASTTGRVKRGAMSAAVAMTTLAACVNMTAGRLWNTQLKLRGLIFPENVATLIDGIR